MRKPVLALLLTLLTLSITASSASAEVAMNIQERSSDQDNLLKKFSAAEFVQKIGCFTHLKNSEGVVSVLVKPGPNWRANLADFPYSDELPKQVVNQFYVPDTNHPVPPDYLTDFSVNNFSDWYQQQKEKSTANQGTLYLSRAPDEVFEMLRATRRVAPPTDLEIIIWRNGTIVGLANPIMGQNPKVDPLLFDVTYFLPNNFVANSSGIPPECLPIFLTKFPEILASIGHRGKVYDGVWLTPVLDDSVSVRLARE